MTIKNADGYGNIGYYYQDAINNSSNQIVFAVYDIDNKQDEEDSPFAIVKEQLLEVLGSKELVDIVSLCTNPNILQMY